MIAAEDRFRIATPEPRMLVPKQTSPNKIPVNRDRRPVEPLHSLFIAVFDARPVPDFTARANLDYFFSITHCRGCWCLRAKSITCVTLVSAIS
jgi:hypothetical protein